MQTVPVAAAVIMRDGRVLGALRRDGLEGPGWEFPGGKLRGGESAEDACRREALEELGCTLGVAWPLDTFVHVAGDTRLSMDVFVCELAPGSDEPKALEHAELRWLAREELLSVEWLPIDAQVVQTLGTFWDELFGASHL